MVCEFPSDMFDKGDSRILAWGVDEWLNEHTPGWDYRPCTLSEYSSIIFKTEDDIWRFVARYANPFAIRVSHPPV